VGETAGEELRAGSGDVAAVAGGDAGFPQASRKATRLAQATLLNQNG